MKSRLFYTALLLVFGVTAGWLASKTLLPLPWMIGSLLACAAWSIKFGDKIAPPSYAFPQKLRKCFIAVIGVMIGSQVTPDLLRQVTTYIPSIFGLLIFSWCAHFLNYKIFLIFGKYDRATAFFSSAPGGLMESIAMSEQYGGEIKIVTLQQFLRIILVIILVPIIISVWFGGPVGSASGTTVNENSNIAVIDLIYILTFIAVGLGLGSQLRMPAGHLLGPMLVTALFSVGMNYRIFLPDILIVVAQIIIGTSLGARFFGMDKNILWTATRLSVMSVISMLILAFLFVMALQYLSVITPITLFISFAPGGVTEMSLIALSVASSPALVSAHHIFRIIITVSLLGFIYNTWIKELN